jgi:predicted unusual protein kinase regulating ubiquinone biosynthesis (AarF/ABC1/UbiB family)
MYRSRSLRILWFFGRAILRFIWWDILLSRIGFGWYARRTRARRMQREAAAYRKLAIRLGGVMIKVGQFLSTRVDVLPAYITAELSDLQDEVAAEKFADIQRVIEAEFGRPLREIFLDFDSQALAAASIGQAHNAHLHAAEGDVPIDVVVKVQRPHIEEIIQVDLAAFRIVARWFDKYPPIRKRADVPALTNEFSQSLLEEVDYLHEGKNAEIFAANFQKRPEIYVPKVYWEYTTRRVLTLENIHGIKISDYAAVEAAGVDRAEAAQRLLDAYFQQTFEDRFFHADPHPGNLFIVSLEEDSPSFRSLTTEQAARVRKLSAGSRVPWQLAFVDFGMTGTLQSNIFTGLREAFIALATQDAARLVRAYQTMKVLLPGADRVLLERASQELFNRLWGKSTTEMMKMDPREMVEFAHEFRELFYALPIQMPENIILFGRCVGILSGMCSGLNPDFNIWKSIVPYAENLVKSEDGTTTGPVDWRFWLNEIGDLLRVLLSLPRKTEGLINRLESGRLEVRVPEVKQQLIRLEHAQRRTALAVIFAAFLLSAVQLYLADEGNLATVAGGAALLLLAGLAFRRG